MLRKLLNYIFKYAVLDEMKIHHLEVTSMNTLTCPKLVVTETGANPAANGQITMNTGVLKGQNNSSGVMPF